MANHADYFRARLEAEAKNREHQMHIEEFAIMCKLMIEKSFPILMDKYLHEKGIDTKLNLTTYLNGRFIDYENDLSRACAKVLQDALLNSGQKITIGWQ